MLINLNHVDQIEAHASQLGPIVVDTVGLAPASGRVTEQDVAVARELAGHAGLEEEHLAQLFPLRQHPPNAASIITYL